MSTDLITLEEALDHLRIDDGDDEDLVESYISAASAAIYTYIGDGVYADDEKTQIRQDVKSACKLLVGDFYRYRESQSPDRIDGQNGYGYLPNYVVALLFPYRELTTA